MSATPEVTIEAIKGLRNFPDRSAEHLRADGSFIVEFPWRECLRVLPDGTVEHDTEWDFKRGRFVGPQGTL